ncbi:MULTISPECIES: STAS domain-containing protein [Actinoplanes]|uniref:STAS domain-containing protein n=1 Tax=Actinoplanes TaxID=1865 RepID=UPI0005F2E1C4|nr:MULTISPECIES: STAS domain-containing protein [Actinoplanes]GLY07831.1 anti-sigma factor antagonist [Actinoplanes sp. NBRC 101535]
MIVTTDPVAGGTVRIRVSGEIDMATADDVQRAVRQALDTPGVTEIAVDLAGVTFCDSSGIAVLDEGFGVAAQHGIRFRAVDPQPVVRRVLEIVGMLDILAQP